MTQTKGHGRINYHISLKKREALKQWSRKQGLTLQDGLDKIVDMGLGIPLSAWNPPPVDTSGLFTRPPQQHQPPRATPVAEPEFDPDVWYLAYIKAGEDRDDAEYSVRDECEKRGISGWVVPNEEAAI